MGIEYVYQHSRRNIFGYFTKFLDIIADIYTGYTGWETIIGLIYSFFDAFDVYFTWISNKLKP